MDAAFDGAANVYILDKAAASIRMFDHSGKFVRTVSRAGSGPGELAEPVAMIHDGKTSLYVVDRVNGLQVRKTDGADSDPRSIRLPFLSRDVCLIEDRLFVFGLFQKRIIHEFTLDGRLSKSTTRVASLPQWRRDRDLG